MTVIKVVENPKRRKGGRRKLSAAQKRSGFGGKRGMSRSRRAPRRKTRRRKNPLMASLGNPKRRVGRNHHYTRRGVVRRRRRSNPRLGPLNIDIMSAVWVGTGVLSTELIPKLVKRFWSGLPTMGPLGYLVKAGAAVGSGMLVGKLTNSRNGALVTAGGLAMIFADLFRQYALPNIPYLSGLADGGYVTGRELQDLYGYVDSPGGVSEYVDQPAPGFGVYVDNPAGAY